MGLQLDPYILELYWLSHMINYCHSSQLVIYCIEQMISSKVIVAKLYPYCIWITRYSVFQVTKRFSKMTVIGSVLTITSITGFITGSEGQISVLHFSMWHENGRSHICFRNKDFKEHRYRMWFRWSTVD